MNAERIETRLASIAKAYTPDLRYLAVLRILFGVWVVWLHVDVSWIGRVPYEFFNPRPGLFFFLSQPPDEIVLRALSIATILLGACVAVGLFTLPASIALSIALITSAGLLYSYSKVNHMILLEIAPLFLAFAGWGCKWSADVVLRGRGGRLTATESRGMPILLFAMTVGWGLLSAAAPKVKGGWLDPDRYASRAYLAREIVRGDRLGLLGNWAMDQQSGAFWKLLDYATIAAEGGLIFVVFFPLLFRIWLLFLASFHIGVYLTLGIDFFDYFLVYAVFMSPLVVWVCRRFAPPPQEVTSRHSSSSPLV